MCCGPRRWKWSGINYGSTQISRAQGPFPNICRLIVEQILPKVKEEKLAEFCDIFCEKTSLQRMNLYLLSKLRRWASNYGFMRMKLIIVGVDVTAELESGAERDWWLRMKASKKLTASKSDWKSLPRLQLQPHGRYLHRLVRCWMLAITNNGSCPTANLQFAMHLGCFMMRA